MKSQEKDVMALCYKILENTEIKAARKHSKAGATIAGLCAFAGGMLLGPPGILVGATVGGAAGWMVTRGKFKPLYQIINELSPKQKQKLYSDVMAALGNLSWDDLPQLIETVMENSSMEINVIRTLITYAKEELGVECENCGKWQK